MTLKIMLQGTGSSVGKSYLVAALCRIFKQDGYSVAPFKSQNMALNSFITEEGLEMGRAQVTQAEAAGIKPSVLMNPVLLKPSSDQNCQVIFRGKVHSNMSAKEYQKFKPELLSMIKEDFDKLSENHDIIVIEGAGSPAEINLRDRDIVNMGMAELVNSPVLLVGDIDRGGVFASLAGTLLLLNENERKRIKGMIINKFRGDLDILKPGITMIEDIVHKEVLGVIPYTDIIIEEEDAVPNRFFCTQKSSVIDIAILYLPHMSNFTDFDPLEMVHGVKLRYVGKGDKIGKCDVLIIPGSKNTIGDLNELKKYGYIDEIMELRRDGTFIIGICGGYQMLGKIILDPNMVEGPLSQTEGIGLLNTNTVICDEKITTQVESRIEKNLPGILKPLHNIDVKGYEIHMGETTLNGDDPFCTILKRNGIIISYKDGCVSSDGKVFGTYIHGIFENTEFTKRFINIIRSGKGLKPLGKIEDFRKAKENAYDKLADVVRKNIDIKKVYEIMRGF